MMKSRVFLLVGSISSFHFTSIDSAENVFLSEKPKLFLWSSTRERKEAKRQRDGRAEHCHAQYSFVLPVVPGTNTWYHGTWDIR